MTTAKRIANWATNLLVSAVVIVVALTFGRETIQWWHANDNGLNSRSAADRALGPGALAPEGAAHLLEFGDFPHVFRHIVVQGDAQAALSSLRAHCRQSALHAVATNAPLSMVEAKALADLDGKQPVAEEAGRWQMYENPAPLPMVLVVTPRKIGANQTRTADTPVDNSVEVVASERRVLSWGLAFPKSGEAESAVPAWALFVWSPGENRSSVGEACPLPPPPGSQRTMSLRSEEGGAVVAFRSEDGSLIEWRRFVDDWAKESDWRTVREWNSINGTWAVRLENKNKTTLDVQLAEQGETRLQALVTVTPPTSPRKQSDPKENR